MTSGASRGRGSMLAAIIVALGAAGIPARAHADEATARVHFRKGVDLYDRKQYAEALAAFEAAYAEKPSAGIKQNIALTLKSMGRTAEAATAFDEALDEGQGTLEPHTRAAIERELAELSKALVTISVKVVDGQGKPMPDAVVTFDGAPLAPGARRRPIRTTQGIHTLTAHVEGLPDPPAKKLAPLLGEHLEATFVVDGAPRGARADGTVSVAANVPDATIRIDGTELGRGAWSGKVPPGAHTLEVSAPGHRTARVEIDVPSGGTVDHPVALLPSAAPPEVYEHRNRMPPPREKRFYVVPMFALQGESLRLSSALGEPRSGARRSFSGASLGVRGGYRFAKLLALEVHAEAGGLRAEYRLLPGDIVDTETRVAHWQLTPVLRFATAGRVRFTLATGFGVNGTSLEKRGGRIESGGDVQGSGVGLSWLSDVGLQIPIGPLYLEPALFMNVHGVGAVREDLTGERLVQGSPAVRAGARIGLGIPF